MASSFVQYRSNLLKTEARELVDDSGIKSDGEIRSEGEETLTWLRSELVESRLEASVSKEAFLKARGYIVDEKPFDEGNFGKVYFGYKVDGGSKKQKLAFKVINVDKVQVLEEANQELSVMKALRHENLMPLVDHFPLMGKMYIVMPRGKINLHEYILRKGPFKEHRAFKIFQQLTDGLIFMHRNGYAHRDFKLTNVLVMNYKLRCKIGDFGLSKVKVSPQRGFYKCKSPIGTRWYMSPEILNVKLNKASEKAISSYNAFWADMWALGVSLFILLNGDYPFRMEKDKSKPEDKSNKAITAVVKHMMLMNYSFRPEIERNLSDVALDIVKCLLNPDPLKRLNYTNIYAHPWMKREPLKK